MKKLAHLITGLSSLLALLALILGAMVPATTSTAFDFAWQTPPLVYFLIVVACLIGNALIWSHAPYRFAQLSWLGLILATLGLLIQRPTSAALPYLWVFASVFLVDLGAVSVLWIQTRLKR